MPTQRFEGKRVEEHVGEGKGEGERERAHACGRERERAHTRGGEREHTHVGDREREHTHVGEKECFGSSFYMFLPPPGPALCKFGLGWSAVCST